MNKILYVSTAALATLSLASCSSDDAPQFGTGDGNVTFQVQLPAELGSRAYFGDGTQAKNLYVAVYDANGNVLDKLTNFNGTTPAAGMEINNFTSGLSTTVTIPLVKGHTYNVVFWADSYAPAKEGEASPSPFTFTLANASMKVDYTKFVGNSDVPDAFFAAVTVPADGTTHKVELKRPFAQINIGTDDLNAASKAGLTVTKGGMKLTGASNALNLLNGEISNVDDFNGNVSFAAQSINTGMDFPVTKTDATATPYEYLAMGYVLCGDAQGTKGTLPTVQLMLNSQETEFATYDNIPAQANFRTNIYGSLLTNKENFQVEINPSFVDSYNNVIPVETQDELVAAVKDGKNVSLTKDLEMDGSFAAALPEGKSVEVDLAGNELKFAKPMNLDNKQLSFVNKANEKSTIKIKSDGSTLALGDGSKLHIKNVDIAVEEQLEQVDPNKRSVSCPILIDGNVSEVIIEDCTIIYRDYAVSTNASKQLVGLVVTMNNVNMIPEAKSQTAITPFLFNRPMTVNAKNCVCQGINNGGIFRGGTFNMIDCTFEQILVPEGAQNGLNVTTKESIKKSFHNKYRNNEWGTGSNVPLAALTVGNNPYYLDKNKDMVVLGNTYPYPTILTLTNCTLKVPEVARNTNNDILSSLPAMYVFANPGEGLGVTIKMTNCKYNEVLEFDSDNIIYNGQNQTKGTLITANM